MVLSVDFAFSGIAVSLTNVKGVICAFMLRTGIERRAMVLIAVWCLYWLYRNTNNYGEVRALGRFVSRELIESGALFSRSITRPFDR